MSKAADAYNELALPSPGFDFTSVPFLGHRIAKARSGYPALLIQSTPSSVGPDYELQYLRVRRGILCSITEPAGAAEGRFTVIEVTDGGEEITTAFLRIADHVAQRLDAAASDDSVETMIGELVRLFSALSDSSSREVQGLWAEVMLICQSRDPGRLVRAWRADPRDWFDFAGGEQRVEVKSTMSKTRRHRFALEQVATPNVKVVVASVLVKRAEMGASVYDLLDRVAARISDSELRFRLEAVAAATIGAGNRAANVLRYDYELSKASVIWVNGGDIPHPIQIPGGVSEVTFVSDLSLCAPVAAERLHQAGGLFSAAAANV